MKRVNNIATTTLHSCHARTSCCTAIKSSSINAQSKRNASVLSIEDEIKIIEMLDKSVICYTFLYA